VINEVADTFMKLTISEGDIVLVKRPEIPDFDISILTQLCEHLGIKASLILVNNFDDIRKMTDIELRNYGLCRIKKEPTYESS
jgi:hypothetical protein